MTHDGWTPLLYWQGGEAERTTVFLFPNCSLLPFAWHYVRRLQGQGAVPAVLSWGEKAFISDLAVSLLLICKLRYKLTCHMPIFHI